MNGWRQTIGRVSSSSSLMIRKSVSVLDHAATNFCFSAELKTLDRVLSRRRCLLSRFTGITI
jgi:hypothetical protein